MWLCTSARYYLGRIVYGIYILTIEECYPTYSAAIYMIYDALGVVGFERICSEPFSDLVIDYLG